MNSPPEINNSIKTNDVVKKDNVVMIVIVYVVNDCYSYNALYKI